MTLFSSKVPTKPIRNRCDCAVEDEEHICLFDKDTAGKVGWDGHRLLKLSPGVWGSVPKAGDLAGYLEVGYKDQHEPQKPKPLLQHLCQWGGGKPAGRLQGKARQPPGVPCAGPWSLGPSVHRSLSSPFTFCSQTSL